MTLIKGDRQNKIKSRQTLFIHRCASSKETLYLIGQENSQSKLSESVKNFDAVNEIFCRQRLG